MLINQLKMVYLYEKYIKFWSKKLIFDQIQSIFDINTIFLIWIRQDIINDLIWFQEFGSIKSIKQLFESDFQQNFTQGLFYCISLAPIDLTTKNSESLSSAK